jgi:serine/threonine protein kinase
VQISPSTWCLGCTVQCDRVAEPDDTCTAAWRDGEDWYTLRPVSEQPAPSEKSPVATPADSHEVSLIHTGGTLSAVWAIGNNAICKVHHWSPDTTSESETIKFVQKMAPQVPIPKVITSWVDGERSFLVLKRVPGITLRDAWGTMSASQQDSILNEVVHCCEILASITSERLQDVSGGPVLEPYLAHSGKDSLEPLNVCESKEYFFRVDLHPNPEIKERFHLYHPDLGPGNILIYDQRLAAIIDWESAGFYPHFWISTKPSVSRGLDFCPPIPGIDETEWRKRLRMKLQDRGYPRFAEWFMEWRKSKSR